MVCYNCKNQIANDSTYCEYCGADFVASAQPNYAPYSSHYAPSTPQRRPISVAGWIGRSLIPYIPIVGPLIYFIMLFVWAFSDTAEKTFNNWAKAQLMVLLIIVIAALLIFLFIFLLIYSRSSAF